MKYKLNKNMENTLKSTWKVSHKLNDRVYKGPYDIVLGEWRLTNTDTLQTIKWYHTENNSASIPQFKPGDIIDGISIIVYNERSRVNYRKCNVSILK